ncbi:hypothetical protein QJ850_gp648 [Acanthamoeba polyphaga mimivirus]|uniref:Uncharacterized protein n=1 Tax=Acanthamoeba polyphaga mimivirus Kroon TaxID=3069720 RepID=A0A0G2YAE3_9VIRU|nr:hypothetical protein QJ850_gp648 [Acanthamoeba polyphaga mimivirus]AKI80051.1 hypothetical protein [Acanthamoeba polyphaga mimivirus Kroon]
MSTENFDPTQHIEEPMNNLDIIHIHNKNNTYHLTKQILLDSMVPNNVHCFFYHILTKNSEEFNKMYGSYARLIARNMEEADLYLNVDNDAFNHIINYIQTSKINGEKIYNENWKKIDDIIDLATILGMGNLVTTLRKLHPTEEQINRKIEVIKTTVQTSMFSLKYLFDYDYNMYQKIIDDAIDRNKDLIIERYIKPNMYADNKVNNEVMSVIISLFTNYLASRLFGIQSLIIH